MKGIFKYTWVTLLFSLFYSTVLQAGLPVWTLTPLTPTTISISEVETTVVQYVVTNLSSRPHTLVMQPIPGITQITEPGSCSSLFALSSRGTPGSSCILTLQVDGSKISQSIIGGPNVCQQGSNLQCYRPGAENILRITISSKKFSIGGSISGLSGTLVLLNNGSDQLTTSSNGQYTFNTSLADGQSYAVTVGTQPSGQICSISNATGVVQGANVTNVNVVCSVAAHTVGGNISGLSGTVTLTNNGSDPLILTSDGSFTFSTPVAQGSPYVVAVQSNPVGQACKVTNGSGTMGSTNVTNVVVTCENTTTLSSPTTGTIPAYLTPGTPSIITITNTGSNPASNVQMDLPVAWQGSVVQDASACTTIPVGNSCNLTFHSTKAFAPQGSIPIIGDNISNSPVTNIAFTVLDPAIPQDYLVWDVDGTGLITQVLDVVDSSGAPWGGSGLVVPQNPSTASTDGSGNTLEIVTFFNASSISPPYAADTCYNHLGALPGVWYLPASCQMAACLPDGNGISNLFDLQFGNLTPIIPYWTSTQFGASPAFAFSMSFGAGLTPNSLKASFLFIRCARSLTVS